MIIQNNNDTTIKGNPIFSSGDEFWTIGETALRRYTVSTTGKAEILNITLYTPKDTAIKEYKNLSETNTEKILYKIISINDNEVIVEIFLENCEVQKKLNKYYISILKDKNKLFVGSEFYIVYEKTQDGLNIRIESYNSEYNNNEIYNDLYKKLVN